jgi:hypothetical protein
MDGKQRKSLGVRKPRLSGDAASRVRAHDIPASRAGQAGPITTIEHSRYVSNRAYRMKIHITLMGYAARGIDPTHLHWMCEADGRCCTTEHVHLSYVRVFNQLQRDGVRVTLVHSDGTPCEHNIEGAA